MNHTSVSNGFLRHRVRFLVLVATTVGCVFLPVSPAEAFPAICVTVDGEVNEGTPQAYYHPCSCDVPFIEGNGEEMTVSTKCSKWNE